ncbi:motility associated factor glycosyltransferase family protein [Sporolactobacillus putidus]|uniref:6-hydroxymethylpterin diphosphokinase MptE-like domain-containing protein n=1 Tax=Sporolactobacillus putidus TaxID=492735 RepID=A0A917W2A5_9BACL|nr:6-hydroxymethylpterin diphosphokinase MptE-like protein [Sporolactobacillus putidus]GGL54486.1 hypothetical protein GCM10007968_18200 [Sporolactobacillus putidus]
MILIENRNYLRFRNRPLLEELTRPSEQADNGKVILETARNGLPTLKLNVDGTYQYIHSKYDPEREAGRLIDSLSSMEQYDHVLFIGSGLGYAIKAFSSAYPNTAFSIYEPDQQVLQLFLSNQNLNDWSEQLSFITSSEQEVTARVQKYMDQLGERFYFFVLPAYEKIYKENIDLLLDQFKNMLRSKKDSMATNVSFQKRWIINAVKNFPEILRTPNILHDVYKSYFKGKPAVLVSAGPSLNEEWDNLRRIKEDGLAYIFSVGSAINALIKHDIYPDAACTYDPQGHNYRVIQIINDRKIKTIPLIFGSTVGFETLEGYEGPMLHMVINQDTVAPQFLRTTDHSLIETLSDAPSIAVVTFELLSKLEFGTVILVGQNLAYLNNQFYATGISYENRPSTLKEEEQKSRLTVKGVNGDSVPTSESFDSMRKQLELYISDCPNVEVINTTKGGAAIDGTEFIPLDQVIDQRLTESVVVPGWSHGENHYDKKRTELKVQGMTKQAHEFNHLLKQFFKAMEQVKAMMNPGSDEQLTAGIDKFDKVLHKLQRNKYYKTFIAPMMRIREDYLKQVSPKIRFEKNVRTKAEMLIKEFEIYANECAFNESIMAPCFKELVEKVNQICSLGSDHHGS